MLRITSRSYSIHLREFLKSVAALTRNNSPLDVTLKRHKTGLTSRSHSIDLSEFLSSVAAHSCSSADRNSRPSPSTACRQVSYKSLVFSNAFNTSLKIKSKIMVVKKLAKIFNKGQNNGFWRFLRIIINERRRKYNNCNTTIKK